MVTVTLDFLALAIAAAGVALTVFLLGWGADQKLLSFGLFAIY